MRSIFVFDFGGQYAHLIANRIRRLGAHSEIVSNTIRAEELQKRNPAGIILSGGPHSVFEDNAPQIDSEVLQLGIPVLGICYGHQLIAKTLGGEVKGAKTHEFGKSFFRPSCPSKIFQDLGEGSVMWMSHGDEVMQLPEGFQKIGFTDDCSVAAMGNEKTNIYGVQFHPEVTHSEKGMVLLKNFVDLCGVQETWSLDGFLELQVQKIQEQARGKKVFLLVSGGVDSSVCFALLEKALGKDRVFGCLIDHGLMRKDEAQEVKEMLASAGFDDLHIENAEEKFLSHLKGVFAPEEKRTIIGDSFLEVQAEVAKRLHLDSEEWILGQGTIYPDTIESGGTEHASKIKTHHNRVPQIEAMIQEGRIIEPIADLYKDEVRVLGRMLGLPEKLIARHPFPGPGLGVRILCAREYDPVLNAESLEMQIKEELPETMTAKILPIRSVGVQGDGRSYRHPIAIFLREKQESYDWEMLEAISTKLLNTISQGNRVVLSLSHSHPPQIQPSMRSEIEKNRIRVLQEADFLVRMHCERFASESAHIWQFPVVLAPIFSEGGEAIILRPIESENAMTANFAKLHKSFLDTITEKLLAIGGISQVFFDLTHKPPGTIEWE